MSELNIYQIQIDNLTKTIEKLDGSVQLLHKKLEDLSNRYIEKDELSLALTVRDDRISSLESNQRWVVRTIIGVVVVALLSVIIMNK